MGKQKISLNGKGKYKKYRDQNKESINKKRKMERREKKLQKYHLNKIKRNSILKEKNDE